LSKRNLEKVREAVYKACQKADFEVYEDDIRLEKPKIAEHGHFSTNIAMLFAGKTGRNPRDIAASIVGHLDKKLFTKTDIAGPGFINLWVEHKFYTTEARSLVGDTDKYLYESMGSPAKKTMVIDSSHPNVAKPMGVHHLLSTIIGDSIKRIYKKVGHKVINDNYLGDWGTQFGKLIYAIRKWGDIDSIKKNPIPELLELYVKFHNEAEKNPKLDDHGREEFKKLEEGDKENRKLWKFIVEKSLDEFEKIYKRLNVTFDHINGESFYEDKMPAILKSGRDKGIFVDGEGGAWIVMPNNPEEAPAVIRKGDGATLYITRDLARIDYWEKTWHPDIMVNVVDVAQEFHFHQLFEVTEKLGLTKSPNVHVKFGRMQFKDVKMSTRKGNIILLEDVLDEAEERAYKLAKEKGLDLSEKETKELARIMGIGAIKYNILSQNRTTNITFEWDKMLSFEGNSVPYLMYTATRAKSVIRKSGATEKDIEDFSFADLTPLEASIMAECLMYPDSIARAVKEFKPNHIANYLYDLAQHFNTFYNDMSILQAPSSTIKRSRLLLSACVQTILADGLSLLGIETPEKM
jgi:arginyl-tRNA synthetase